MAQIQKFAWLPAVFFLGFMTVEAGEKITIGSMESIILSKWNVRLPARVDTGATVSSLGVENYKISGNEVEVRLARKFGGGTWRVPIHAWRNYKTSTGRERRPVVRMEICVGSKQILAEVNISKRPGMEFPFLIGRNILQNRFIVDVGQAYLLFPDCRGENAK